MSAIRVARGYTGRDLIVTFNYRYSPRNTKVKEIIKSGIVGDITTIHFEWLLDGVKVDELTSSESVMSAATWVPDMPEKVMQIQIGTEYARRGENNGGIFEYYEYAEPVEQDQ